MLKPLTIKGTVLTLVALTASASGAAIAQQSASSSSQPRSATASASQRPYAHIPHMAAFPASYRPRYIDFRVTSADLGSNTNLIGTMGVYASCETARGSKPLRIFGNRSNRVMDRDRSSRRLSRVNLAQNAGTRRFIIDRNCLTNRNARIKFELKTNLTEDRRVGRDTAFGYRAVSVYLDQLPREKATRSDTGFSIRSPGEARWVWETNMTRDKRLVAKLLNPILNIKGSIRLVR